MVQKFWLQLNDLADSSGNLNSCILEVHKHLDQELGPRLDRIEAIDFLINYQPESTSSEAYSYKVFKRKDKIYVNSAICSGALGARQRSTRDYDLRKVLDIVTGLYGDSMRDVIKSVFSDDEDNMNDFLVALEETIKSFKRDFSPEASPWFEETPSQRRKRQKNT